MTEEMPIHPYEFGAPDTCKNCGERAFHENHWFYREVNALWPGDDLLAISCNTFRVIKRTPQGAWVVPEYWADRPESWDRLKRFILEGDGRRYAYPTRELARESFIARKKKEIQHCARQHDRAVRYLALAETGKFGTRLEALHEIKTRDMLLPELRK
jgi:hypothetical protein